MASKLKSKEPIPERLIRMLSINERSTLVHELGLSAGSTSDDVGARLRELPRYECVRLFLKVADPTLLLLKDIFAALDQLGSAVSTTGCVFVLSEPSNLGDKTEVAFSRQTVGAVCRWSSGRRWNRPHRSFESLSDQWAIIETELTRLTREARLRTTPVRRRLRPGPGGVDVFERGGEDEIDIDAHRVLEHFVKSMSALVGKFDRSFEPITSRKLTELIEDVRSVVTEAERVMSQTASYRARWMSIAPVTKAEVWSLTTRQFLSKFDRFVEDVYLLFDLDEAEQNPDLLRLDVWSTRPQLYEIWVMLTILGWLMKRGYEVTLLRRTPTKQASAFRWNLSYAKDTKPCAEVIDPDGNRSYLFFQLYRPSKDMPDISLLSGEAADSPAIWSVDPKHSEKKGYALDDYKKTSERYRDSFGAKLSLVVDYFDRSDVAKSNPLVFSENAILVHDCRPGGAGFLPLRELLEPFHPTSEVVLVCLDLSASFRESLVSNLGELRAKLLSDFAGAEVSDRYICFAGSAESRSGLKGWLSDEDGELELPDDLGSDTASGPLLEKVRAALAEHRATKLLLISDGRFDVSPEALTAMLIEQVELDVEIASW